jgi:hypothetical protein
LEHGLEADELAEVVERRKWFECVGWLDRYAGSVSRDPGFEHKEDLIFS